MWRNCLTILFVCVVCVSCGTVKSPTASFVYSSPAPKITNATTTIKKSNEVLVKQDIVIEKQKNSIITSIELIRKLSQLEKNEMASAQARLENELIDIKLDNESLHTSNQLATKNLTDALIELQSATELINSHDKEIVRLNNVVIPQLESDKKVLSEKLSAALVYKHLLISIIICVALFFLIRVVISFLIPNIGMIMTLLK